jgi:hypothetical protein
MEQELKLQQERIQEAMQKAQAELFQIDKAEQQLQARRAELERQLIAGSGALELANYLLQNHSQTEKEPAAHSV